MKSYFQGLITGIFFTASLILFMGQTTFDKQIKKQLKELEKLESEIETLGKSMSKTFNDNQLSMNDLNNDHGISIDNKFKRLNQKIDYIYKTIDQKIDRIYTSTNDNNGILQDIYTDGIPCNK
tara:strand:- start:319 stop:687 length:369 start_codon:yes stop_codon:yes gene_type:complete